MRLWKILCNWTLRVFQISCNWIRMNRTYFGSGGAGERLDRGELSGKLIWRCKPSAGYDMGFFIVLKTRKWSIIRVTKCLRFITVISWVGTVWAFSCCFFFMLPSYRFYGRNKLGEDRMKIKLFASLITWLLLVMSYVRKNPGLEFMEESKWDFFFWFTALLNISWTSDNIWGNCFYLSVL